MAKSDKELVARKEQFRNSLKPRTDSTQLVKSRKERMSAELAKGDACCRVPCVPPLQHLCLLHYTCGLHPPAIELSHDLHLSSAQHARHRNLYHDTNSNGISHFSPVFALDDTLRQEIWWRA